MQSSSVSKNIDTYIENLPPNIQLICKKLRQIIHTADSTIEEAWKWSSPYFMYKKKPLCLVWGFTHHASLTFLEGALLKDTQKIFNYGEDNKKSRTIKFNDISEVEKIGEQIFLDYIHAAMKNIDEGKHVKIPVTKDKTVILPPYIKTVLKKEGLLQKYEEQIFTYRKGYLQWIEQAKTEETKQKRINIMLKELHTGKEYMGMERSDKK